MQKRLLKITITTGNLINHIHYKRILKLKKIICIVL